MPLSETLVGGGLGLVVLLSLVQVSPLKIDPWHTIGRAVGRVINGDVLCKLEALENAQRESKQDLERHIAIDDERNADLHRARILQFNNELLRDIPHTREDFIEILSEIDNYDRYCENHEGYQNNRAVHAIANIGRVYDDRLKKHDFL